MRDKFGPEKNLLIIKVLLSEVPLIWTLLYIKFKLSIYRLIKLKSLIRNIPEISWSAKNVKLWSTKNVIRFTYLFFLHDVRSPFVSMTLPFYSLKGMSSLSLRQQLFEINAHVHCFSKMHFRVSSLDDLGLFPG